MAETNVKTTEPLKDRPLRVYADGVYDLFHFGHSRSLEPAKKLSALLPLGLLKEKQLRAHMGLEKLQEKVKKQQEKGNAIRDRIQEQLRKQQLLGLTYKDNDNDDDDQYY